jgi:hypothetical protein
MRWASSGEQEKGDREGRLETWIATQMRISSERWLLSYFRLSPKNCFSFAMACFT